ncbi:TrkA C-terminal domain-containing protein [Halobellus sp. H-GB7]|uniref:cation:proton antiporter regulatory subunit n=1 Tax=Halobellus sp. H-GB7 TaxID=3069756 RepID=UPI0027B0BF1F|nr:TrkA C-terminal domain-containing protein [Halobellus sp. H-GB7]MDQ2056134.1 TrkA C-terminal domain-containing protein [Halobellus sp. H-GB7]
MTVYESDLPGVGKKHEIDLPDGSQLVVVTHNEGRREVFLRPTPESDSEKLFELSDQLARQIGTILEGAYFQPVRSESIETLLGGDTLLEWVEVGADSPIVDRTLGDSNLRQETGASVVAIERADEVIPSPGGETTVRAGDTLVIVGTRENCDAFEARVTGE